MAAYRWRDPPLAASTGSEGVILPRRKAGTLGALPRDIPTVEANMFNAHDRWFGKKMRIKIDEPEPAEAPKLKISEATQAEAQAAAARNPEMFLLLTHDFFAQRPAPLDHVALIELNRQKMLRATIAEAERKRTRNRHALVGGLVLLVIGTLFTNLALLLYILQHRR